MKKFPVYTLISLLAIIFQSPDLSGMNTGNEMHSDSPVTMMQDTTVSPDLLETVPFRLKVVPPAVGVQFYKDGIVFLSDSKSEKKMSPDQISFGNVEAYYASVHDTLPGKHLIFSPSFSFSYPCEAMTFSRDFNTVYFTKISKEDKKEKIYTASLRSNDKIKPGMVAEISPLEFCSANSAYSHPALSSDENVLIFASDKEGSLGGMDLFMTRRKDGKWSSPENLGNLINTPGNEFFPFWILIITCFSHPTDFLDLEDTISLPASSTAQAGINL